MIQETLYGIIAISSCYTAFQLLQAVRQGEFKPTDYGRPPVFSNRAQKAHKSPADNATQQAPQNPLD